MAMKLSDEHKQVVYWIGGIFADAGGRDRRFRRVGRLD